MTTIFPGVVSCAVCDRDVEVTMIGSTNRFGSPDLDFRPPEMMRSTMGSWVHECPSCGYCAEALDEADAEIVTIVKGDSFRSFRSGAAGFGQPAKMFHSAAFIAAEAGKLADAFHHTLHEAWAHDDAGDSVRASAARLNAVDLLNHARGEGQRLFEEEGADDAVTVDLLRRAGEFGHANEVCQKVLSGHSEEEVRRLLDFQFELCGRHDTGGHTMAEVFGEDAD
jgi:hypothetical protein